VEDFFRNVPFEHQLKKVDFGVIRVSAKALEQIIAPFADDALEIPDLSFFFKARAWVQNTRVSLK
jgi:hypothetical protein